MIKHIVLFKLKNPTEENIEKAVQVVKDMEGKIEVMISMEIGVNFVKSQRASDISLTAIFSTVEDLNIYQQHPAHMPLKVYMREVCASISSVDYEY